MSRGPSPPVAQEILDRIREGVVVLDGAWRYVYVNRLAGEILGRDPETLQGRTVWEAFPDAPESAFGPPLRRAMAERVTTHRDAHYGPLDRWIDVDIHPTGEGLTVIFRDVAERHRTEADIESRARQQAAVAMVSQAVLEGSSLETVYDLAVVEVAASLDVPLCKVLVLDPEAGVLLLVAGRGWREGQVGTATVAADPRTQAGYTLDRGEPVIVSDFAFEERFLAPPLLAEHDVVSGMSVVIRADGSPFGILGAHSREPRRFTGDETRFLGSMANVLGLAVTQSRDRARLAESETRFRQIAEHTDAVLYMATPELREILYVNPAYERIWGRPRSQLVAAPLSFLDAVHPEDRDRIAAAVEARPSWRFDETYRIVRPGGDVRWIHDRMFPVTDGDGQVARVVGLAEDVTELRAAAQATRHLGQERLARARAEASVKARDEVLAYVSHELRSPLASIGLTIDLLKRRGTVAPLDSSIDVLERSAEQMERLIRDLLDVARLEAGRLAVETVPADLATILAEVATEATARLGDRAIRVVVDTASGLPEVLADPARLRQILVNLVTNAEKFTREGRITLKAVADGARVVVSVADTGRGLAPEDVPRLFDRFWQGRAGDRRGAGLGLAIVKGLVEAHGGQVSAESEEGLGTTITFTLPVATGGKLETARRPRPAPRDRR